MKRCKRRDRAVASFSDEDLQRAYRYALSLTGDRDHGLELVHAALEHWLSEARSGVASPMAYLLTSVRNRLFDQYRHGRKFRSEPLGDDSNSMEGSLRDLESILVDADHVRWLLQQLEPRDREVIYLWAVEGYTVEQISEHTGSPRGTLLARLHRLRQRLQLLDARREARTGASR